MRIFKSIICLFMCFALICPYSVFADEQSDYEQENAQLQQQIEANVNSLAEIQQKADDIENYMDELNTEISSIESTIDSVNALIKEKGESVSALNQSIFETSTQIDELNAEIQNQYYLMKLRIQYTYENFGMSFYETVFSSETFADAIKKIQYAIEVTEYNNKMKKKCQDMVNELNALQEKQITEQAQMQQEVDELTSLSSEKQSQQDLLTNAKSLKQEELEEAHEEEYDIQTVISEIQGRMAANQSEIDSLIAAYEAERAAKSAQTNNEVIDDISEDTSENTIEDTTDNTTEDSENEYSEDDDYNENVDYGSDSASTEENYEEDNASEEQGYIWPLNGYSTISSYFGYRGDDTDLPEDSNLTYHYGVDIIAPEGTPIHAIKDGIVVVSDYSYYIGYYMVVYHGDGIYSEFHHMCQFGDSVGTYVSQGDTIGYTGSTGYYCYGAHLHFAMNSGGNSWAESTYVNPLSFYPTFCKNTPASTK